jgi:hypothetical protein
MSDATRTRRRAKATWDWADVPQSEAVSHDANGVSARGKRAIRNVTKEVTKEPYAGNAHGILAALHTRLRDLAAVKDQVEREMAEVQHQIDTGGWDGGPVYLHQITPGHMMTPDLAADIRKARADGMTYDAIAATFNVSRSYAHAMVKGRKTHPLAYLKNRKDQA